MTEIFEKQLYLGGFMDVTEEFLTTNKIKYVINVASECDNLLEQKCPEIKFYKFNLDDIDVDITAYFELIPKIIKKRLSNGPILIHCMYGLSRSASMVLAYLILESHMTLFEAFTFIRTRRKILPNPSFMKQLMTLEEQTFGSQSYLHQIDDYTATYIIYRLNLNNADFYWVKQNYLDHKRDYNKTIQVLTDPVLIIEPDEFPGEFIE